MNRTVLHQFVDALRDMAEPQRAHLLRFLPEIMADAHADVADDDIDGGIGWTKGFLTGAIHGARAFRSYAMALRNHSGMIDGGDPPPDMDIGDLLDAATDTNLEED